MQRLLPSSSGALGVLALIVFSTQMNLIVQGAESDWDPNAMESRSTLGAQIAPQEFGTPPSILDVLGQETIVESRLLWPAKPAPKARRIARSASSHKPQLVDSPFTKWISPKTSSTKSLAKKPGTALKTKTKATTSKATTATDRLVGPQLVAPQKVARRIRTSTRSRSQSTKKSSTSQSKSNTNHQAKQSKKKSAKKSTTSRRTAKAKPLVVKSFPTPKAELTSEPMRVNLANLPPLTTSQKNLRKKIRRVLTYYHGRPLNTRDRSPWEMMHALLAYEVDSKLLVGGPRGKSTSAVGWLCFNQSCKRRTLMYVSDEGEMRVRVGPALQGHRGQLLAMLAQAKVSKDYPMRIEGHDFTIGDLVKMEMRTCYPRTELTFKLIGLMHYLDSDATWMNDQGMQWNISRLISEELRQPVRGAACGGTHRLSGLTLAYKTRQQRGEPVDGQYLKAKKFVQRYQQYAYRLQNRDGSFSTEWFRGPGNEKSIDRKFKTTGHLLEWLLYAASEKELKSSKTTRAANYLATIMYNNSNKDWETGPLGHAIHALLVYDRLVFSPYDKIENMPVAGKSPRSDRARSKR